MSDSDLPETVWAVHDQVVTADSEGFSQHYTIGLAEVRDPGDEAFLRGPDRLRILQGMVFPDSRLKEWGWEPVGDWTTIITKTRPPVETRSFGVIMPYRDVVQVRRIAEAGEAAGGSEAGSG
jgi:hypothetical protein